MQKIKGKFPNVPGFKAGGISCGIKANNLLDLAMIVSDPPATAAGMFTTNRVQAPSVVFSRGSLAMKRKYSAIVVNSGNANACTGPQGMEDCRNVARAVATELGVSTKQILLASTGIIGVPLPANKIVSAAPQLHQAVSEKGWDAASKAIMTTDLTQKVASLSYQRYGKTFSLGGITKGSGMIHPNMATMLGFIVTDVAIRPIALKTALKIAVQRTFNRITVDGDQSTNDCVMIMANGMAGNAELNASTPGYDQFVESLTELCKSLAIQIVEDGEGATKFATVRVTGAKSENSGHQVANSVARSSLFKTALFGEDPNWGRILAAVGYAGIPFKEEDIRISLNDLVLFENGMPTKSAGSPALKKKMKAKNIVVEIDLAKGRHQVEVYTCDLSYDYVKINADYTT
ncbi:MAG: bifunctional ornithine acetyltransferase/N-acetylglutamate synthase [Nitrospinae bacterium CG11_big_fil_rev_8_21_14_0_20_45_15]|nr:MAG: bifunctional ornithine acetyltransferase/N-acetylglutamate synthase [Nitrospinae bacterium CG11_big_fil_rev_8_21_14_0_20_45_15]